MRQATAARRIALASSVIAAACLVSALVPLAGQAPPTVTVFWLLAIPPVWYAGVWLMLGILGVTWLTGWRPRPRN